MYDYYHKKSLCILCMIAMYVMYNNYDTLCTLCMIIMINDHRKYMILYIINT